MRFGITLTIVLLASSLAAAAPVPMPVPRPAIDGPAKTAARPDAGLAKPADTAKPAPDEKPRPAKELFGSVREAAPLAARAIGFYSKGCLAGGIALPVDGATWQVMRLSRNRNWGHPHLIKLLERLSAKAPKIAGWHGILVGDLAQPRGGPMLTGHASHQLGLDADVWLTPMPDRRLSKEERESLSATMIVRPDRRDVDANVWTPGHLQMIKAAAEEKIVERIFVNAAIKKALCREAGSDRGWLEKVRPYWGHDYHMHIRIRCPDGNADCQPQDPVGAGDGCGNDLDYWFQESILNPPPPKEPPKPKPPLTMSDLPAACRQVLIAR
jgi:penicillin-insensitive murein endopeptidase